MTAPRQPLPIDAIDVDAAVKQIEAALAREEAEQEMAYLAADVPRSAEAITAEWLTAITCARTPGAAVGSFSLGEGSAGTSVRRAIKVKYNEVGKAAGLCEHLFAKTTPDAKTRFINGATGTMIGEATFFNKMRPELDLQIPVSVHAGYDLEGLRSILVFEDLTVGHETEFCSLKATVTLDRARQMIRLMAAYHAHFYEDPRFKTTFSELRTMSHWWRLIHALLNRDVTHEAGMSEAGPDIIPAGIFNRREEIWRVYWNAVSEHEKAPATLIHNDPHIGNWYILDGGMGLGDWQCACVGSWARDISYAITCSLTVENRRSWEKELIELYVDQFNGDLGSTALGLGEAWRLYKQQMVLALYFWTDVLCHSSNMPDMQPRDLTIELIKRISTAMDDWAVLDC